MVQDERGRERKCKKKAEKAEKRNERVKDS